MGASSALLRFVAKAALNAVGGGVLGDFAVEALPDIARDVWGWWGKDRKPEELRQEVQTVASLPLTEVQRQAAEVVAQEAAGRSDTERQKLTAYLAQLPNAIRQSQRRPQDPSGRSVSALLSLHRAEDLLPLLPPRPPRFTVGDRPPGIGDWELVELLGMGGFGEVWKARNPHLPEPVALKFCLDPEAARVLRNEAALLGRVRSQGQHPRIVRLLHTYLNADPPCLEYEFVAGGDLTGLVYQQMQKGQGKLPPGIVFKVLHKLARAMTHPHRLDPPIVHRDLKPANILVQRGEDGLVHLRITDFGIGGVAASQAIEQARGASTGHFLATALRGAHTPLYASPQQVEGAAPDPRDDVYALGVIGYQMLIGNLSKGAPHGNAWKTPFLEQGVRPEALELLQLCFEDDPAFRPADAGVLAERLEELGKKTVNEGSKITTTENEPGSTEGGGRTKVEDTADTDKTVGQPRKTAAELCAEGEQALQKGDYTQAIRAYTQALKLDGSLAAAYRNRARAYQGKGDHDKAINDLTELLKIDPKDAEGYVSRGVVQGEKGDADKAIGDFTRAIGMGLRSAAVFCERGRAYADKGVYDLALADFGEALRLEPGATTVYLHRGCVHEERKDLAQALADYEEAIRLDPARGEFFNARGMAHYHKGEMDLALEDLIRALQLAPNSAEAYYNRGQVYARKGNHEQAIADYTQAIRLGLKSGRVYYQRGLARSRLHKPAQAIADFTRAIKSSSRNPEIYLMRGLAHGEREDHAAAIADFTRAIQRDRDYLAAYHNRARSYLRSGKYGKAIKDFSRVIEQRPQRADAYEGRAAAHCLKKQFDQAIADSTEALRLNPTCAGAYCQRSRAHLGKGALEQAIADAGEAIRLEAQPAHFEARGLANCERGEYDLATIDFTQAIKLDPKNAALYRSRSRIYGKMGESAKAEADRARADKLAPASSRRKKSAQGKKEGKPNKGQRV
jgi:tetratricopeptide (TPR) repeat protein